MDKVLVIGGTNFIGRNLIERLVELKQFDVCLFNRGLTNPELFPEIRKIKGDRNTDDVEIIAQENWDYIIDLSGFFPDSIDRILNSIDPSVKRYIFISSCSVYDNGKNKSFRRGEDAAILDCSDSESIDESVMTYGNRKAECERRLQNSKLPFFILRPALVYGKYDDTDRLYYWLYQVKTQNELLIPNRGEQPFSITFVDDLISCIVEMLEKLGDSETYNVTTYPTTSISRIVDAASNLMHRSPNLHYADSDFLKKEQIKEWVDMPLWLDCDYFTYDNSKLISDFNFDITDFEESLNRTIEYFDRLKWAAPKYGITDERKRILIENRNIKFHN